MKGFVPRATFWLVILLAGLLIGCVTSGTKVWNARVGVFTYDQAVVELGPPDKQAKLENGVLVADWLVRRGYAYADVSPGFYGPYHRHFYYPMVTQGYSPDYFLRLTFGPDTRLQSWKNYAR